MSEPQSQQKADDSLLAIAADFVRVLWSPTAVFRRRRTTSARRVLFVLWVIGAVSIIPLLAGFLSAVEEAEPEVNLLLASVVVATFGGLVLVSIVAFVDGAAVWLGAAALGRRLPLSRAIVVAAFSSIVLLVVAIPLEVAFFVSGQQLTFADAAKPPDLPAWMDALMLNLSPLAPESRPVLTVLLAFIGIPAFWLAVLHAIGARENRGLTEPILSTAPVFWAASATVTLVFVLGIIDPLTRWGEEAVRAAADAADTTRAPARVP